VDAEIWDVRQLGSKLLAGGLSAGVVLLWCRPAALATTALALPLALIAVGVTSHIPTGHSAAPPKVMQVTRVVRVVKPVRVQRVVKIRTVSQPVPVASQPTYRAPAAAVHKHASAPTKHVSTPTTPAPHPHVKAPMQQTSPTTPMGESPPATQNQSTLPSPDQSGAGAQPTS
jgi:hypothetical protein